jgi:hypothetical protein
MAAAAGVLDVLLVFVLMCHIARWLGSLSDPGETYETVYAPPAVVRLQLLQLQMPTACLFTVTFPQKAQVYLACCEVSIFLTIFLREAPYLSRTS